MRENVYTVSDFDKFESILVTMASQGLCPT